MSILKKIIRDNLGSGISNGISNGISRGISKAVGEAVNKAVAPAAERYANRTAERFNEATDAMGRSTRQATDAVREADRAARSSGFSGLEGAFGNLRQSIEGYATEASKNMKLCPACGEATTADRKFCPACGAKLPEQTMAQGTVCPACGKQNTLGTAFCADCGTKLPAAVESEQATDLRNQAALDSWEAKLPGYPKWDCGGRILELTSYPGDGYCTLDLEFDTGYAADLAIDRYRAKLRQNGFDGSPNNVDLYKRVGGVTLRVDSSHAHDGDAELPTLYFITER